MNLLLLSISTGAVPAFITDCTDSGNRPLRLGYVADAAEGMPFAEAERSGVEQLGHEVVEVRARDCTKESFATFLDSVDAVYVAGGETFALLEALRSNGTGDVLAGRVRAGLPYIGCSAGSIIAGPSITPAEIMDDRSAGPGLASDDGLGLLEQVVIPHADGQLPPYPVELIQQAVATYGDRFPIVTLRDDQALRVRGEKKAIIESL